MPQLEIELVDTEKNFLDKINVFKDQKFIVTINLMEYVPWVFNEKKAQNLKQFFEDGKYNFLLSKTMDNDEQDDNTK